MAYGGGYNGGGGGYQQRGGGYQQSQYKAPQKPQFSLEEEASKYAFVYLTLKEQLQAGGVELEEVKDYLGGWTTSLKLSMEKSGG